MLALSACEREFVVKPELDGPTPNQPVSGSLVISYDETSISTSPPPPNSAGDGTTLQTGSTPRVLRHYERTRRTMTIHPDGSVSVEVRYLEGNSDIRIPMELYNRIKHRLHPPDPARKPITRFTIANNTYTGYAEDGSVVHVRSFPQQARGMANALTKINAAAPMPNKATMMEELAKSGAWVQQLNEREIIIERVIADSRSQVAVKKEAVNTETWQTVRSVTYDRSGRPITAQRVQHQIVDGFPVPSLIVTYRYGEVPGRGWAVQQTTIEQRMNISVQRF